jgi:hypothetical protein
LMWGFDVTHAKDENGVDIPVDATFGGMVPGATAAPQPFKCSESPLHCFFFDLLLKKLLEIRVRSPQHEKVLRQEWMDAQAEGLKLQDISFEGAEEDVKA